MVCDNIRLIKVTAQLRIDFCDDKNPSLLIKLEQTFHHIFFAFFSFFFTFKRLCKAMKVGCGCDFKRIRCGLFSWNRKIKTKCVRWRRTWGAIKRLFLSSDRLLVLESHRFAAKQTEQQTCWLFGVFHFFLLPVCHQSAPRVSPVAEFDAKARERNTWRCRLPWRPHPAREI